MQHGFRRVIPDPHRSIASCRSPSVAVGSSPRLGPDAADAADAAGFFPSAGVAPSLAVLVSEWFEHDGV